MTSKRTSGILVATLAVASIFISISEAPGDTQKVASPKKKKIDAESGMIIDKNWQTVRTMCSSCHSPKLFTNYGGTRETWAGLIDWMQEKQGLWQFPPTIEEQILTYLSENYPPGKASRRRNLPAHQRPPNPYTSEARAEYEKKVKEGKIKPPVLETGEDAEK